MKPDFNRFDGTIVQKIELAYIETIETSEVINPIYAETISSRWVFWTTYGKGWRMIN